MAAVYEMTGLDYCEDLAAAQRLAAASVYWCPCPTKRHRYGWSILYNRDGEIVGVWPARPCKAPCVTSSSC